MNRNELAVTIIDCITTIIKTILAVLSYLEDSKE